MPRKTPASTPTSRATAEEAHAPIAAIAGGATETFVQTCERCTNGAATVNAEMTSFINKRLTHDVEFGEAVIKCENWAGIINVQQEWARQAMEEYLAEATRLVELAAKLTEETWAPVYERTNQVLTELNKPLS